MSGNYSDMGFVLPAGKHVVKGFPWYRESYHWILWY